MLADWLLRARPAHAVEVATYTPVHALLRGEAAVFDALSLSRSVCKAAVGGPDRGEAGLIDDGAFMGAYLCAAREFVWEPDLAQLVS